MHTYVHMWSKSIVRRILLGRKSHRFFGIHTYWGVVLVLRLRFMFLFSVVQMFSRPSRAMVYTIVLSTESQDDEDLLTPIWTHDVSTRKEGLQICRLLRRLFRALGYRANFFHLSVESS